MVQHFRYLWRCLRVLNTLPFYCYNRNDQLFFAITLYPPDYSVLLAISLAGGMLINLLLHHQSPATRIALTTINVVRAMHTPLWGHHGVYERRYLRYSRKIIFTFQHFTNCFFHRSSSHDTAFHTRPKLINSPPPPHPIITMIYDVKSDYYQTFLSSKQGARGPKPGKAATPAGSAAPDGDVMDTAD